MRKNIENLLIKDFIGELSISANSAREGLNSVLLLEGIIVKLILGRV
jgi:hypothetical protein